MEGCLEKRAKGDIRASHRPSRVAGRIGLSDITNIQCPLSPSKLTTLSSEMDAIQNLQKENMMLRRLIEEKNNLIKVTALEVEKLRVNMQKVYTQNWQLAKANSQMLAELNSGKDKLKEKQHEHGCALALLRAKNSELEEKLKNQSCHIIPEAKVFNCNKVPAMSHPASTCGKATTRKRSHQSKNTTLSVKSSDGQQVLGKLDNRRRRSSANKEKLSEHSEDLFDLKNTNFSNLPVPDEAVHEDFPASCDLSVACVSTSGRELKEVEEAEHLLQNENIQEPKPLVGGAMITEVQNGCSSVEKPMKTEKRRSSRRRSSLIHLEPGTNKSLKVEYARIPKQTKSINFPAAVETEENRQRWSDAQPLQGRRSMRIAAVEKVISYKEKSINIKERRV
ncbi:hypothetical protein H6P81_009506 [Aristolochia fimbriata]|uniref:Shugoshin C-terminal domain-containing protein n=1 Tax=Aristolochia fimbriata TaxID=158543 RepID=A0AAV7EM74_ARIFI|nr:hypothetical protein H6P81_009506 [Aristolochia fimbriata]